MEDLDFRHLHVEFFMDTKHNKRRSEEAGRPIYDDVEKIRIRMAGDRGTVLVAPAHDVSSVRDHMGKRLTYAELHAGPYEAFRKNIEYHGSGTPLAELPFLTAAQRKELGGLNIHTAEALCAIDGENLKRIGGPGRQWKNQAQEYLDKADSLAHVAEVAHENEALKKRLEQLEAVVANNSQEEEGETPMVNSPFKDWRKEDIINWIVDSGGDKPHHKCSHATVVAMADTLNEKLKAA